MENAMLSPATIMWPFYWLTVKTGAGFSRGTVPINSRSCRSRCLEQDVSTSFQHDLSGGRQWRAVVQMKTQIFSK